MDRETVRIVLLVTGILAIVGVYVWGVYKQQILDFLHRRGEFDELQFETDNDEELDIYDEKAYGEERVTRRHEPYFTDDNGDEDQHPPAAKASSTPLPQPQPEPENRARTAALGAPFLIQVSIIGKNDRPFSGPRLKEAFTELELIHGDMGIYHRMDQQLKEPLFSLASLVEPGTFPRDSMEAFECPGIVLFFQPAKVPDPLEVFDNLLDTCHELSTQLDGIEWDESREPLTLRKIADMRHRLSKVYDAP